MSTRRKHFIKLNILLRNGQRAKNKKKIEFLLVLILFFWGCASGELVKVREDSPGIEKSRVFTKDYESVWSAMVKTLSVKGYPTQSLDKSSGVISTDFRVTKEAFLLASGYRHKLTIFLEKKSEAEIQITITPIFEWKATDEAQWQSTTRSAAWVTLEKEIFDAVQKNL